MQDVETLYDSPLLEHRNRRAIVRRLTEKPGMNRNQLQEAMHASLGVVDFHLRKLVDAGIVVRKPSANDKEILLFTRRTCHLWTNPNTRVLFGGEFTRNVALAVLEEPGATTREIASVLDLEPVTVRYHLAKLKEDSLIGDIRVGNLVEYHPTRELNTWFDKIGHVYDRPWDEETEVDADADAGPSAEVEAVETRAAPDAESEGEVQIVAGEAGRDTNEHPVLAAQTEDS